MPPRRLVMTFLILWWTLGATLLFLSARTVRLALASTAHDPHVALLGAIEAVSALLFLWPRTMRAGAWGLLATIAVAFLLHAHGHQFRGDLLVYAAAVLFVSTHGPVTKEHLSAWV